MLSKSSPNGGRNGLLSESQPVAWLGKEHQSCFVLHVDMLCSKYQPELPQLQCEDEVGNSDDLYCYQ
jgi:hypothetical protein